jgi:hypothetical protein
MTSLNLVAGSHPEKTGTSPSGLEAERRRLPRVSLTQEQFRLAETGKIFSVTDLSPGGMALRVIDPNDLILLTVGSHLEGTLNLRREKIPVAGQVRHVLGERVGIAFEGLSSETIRRLSQLLDPRILGADLRPMPSGESLGPLKSSGASGLWFHGSSGTDLWLERGADGSVRRFLFLILGGYVRWELAATADGSVEESDFGVLTTGLSDSVPPDFKPEEDEIRGVIRWETHWFRPDPKLDREKLALASAVLEAATLADDLKRILEKRLQRSPT